MDDAAVPPGWPGLPARWTSSAKVGVGTSVTSASRVWFTLSHGIVDEVYYPRVDIACTRDLGLIVTDGKGFFSEEKRHTTHTVAYPTAGVPAYRLVNTCAEHHYRIEKDVLADPARDVVLQRIRFTSLDGGAYRIYALLAPHLDNRGDGNTAWVGDYKGIPMLFAAVDGSALALAASGGWGEASAGYVGVSDGWQDLSRNYRLTVAYQRAEDGNVALTGRLLPDASGETVLALAFGRNWSEAAHRARASLQQGFEATAAVYTARWQQWHGSLQYEPLKAEPADSPAWVSAMVVRIHESIAFPGGLVASLSIPWGTSRGDDDIGGYHLVWPRDLVESAGALLAAGAHADVRRVVAYLETTQEADGSWPQNMWLDGTPYWRGVQMDETAFPVLLVDLARRKGALSDEQLAAYWPMVRAACGYLVRNGPVTQQDRWEEDPGYSPFTLAVEIAALLAGADLADLAGETAAAGYLRDTADWWNDAVERWTYVQGTDLARDLGIDGYYVRIAPPDLADGASPATGFVPIKNRPPGDSSAPAGHIISPDALALVRFGLRSPTDPRIVSTVAAVDRVLKSDTPVGPGFHRYTDDGYGEHEDGEPFDGTGVGRLWPLLTGERAHYELAAGRPDEARRLMGVMAAFANDGGMLPEQVWDGDDIPEKELWKGRPSGSAMPLVWAHAEYLKLWRSLREGEVFDTPPQPVERYRGGPRPVGFRVWRFNHKLRSMPAGLELRIETLAPARIHWSADGWATFHDEPAVDTDLGVFVARIPTAGYAAGTTVAFTMFWPEPGRWEGTNYEVLLAGD